MLSVSRPCLKTLVIMGLLSATQLLFAAEVVIPMHSVAKQGVGESIGSVKATDTRFGLELRPDLHSLPGGVHGYHIHMKPDCNDDGMAAGGHLDPHHTDSHRGPFAEDKHGHLGDLPILVVNKDGTATLPSVAPRLTVAQIRNHALMIHAGGDNYADQPEKLGGGGARIACGVIPK